MENKTSTLKAAICDFKKKDIAILKDKDNPFYKSKYADLSSILGAVEAELAEVGLLVTSIIKYHETNLILETTLEHKDSDEKLISIFPVFGSKPQEIGSSVTYARRYNIQSLLNLAAEDDDGNATQQAKQVKKPEAKLFATAKERIDLFNAVLKDIDETQNLDELAEVWSIKRQADIAKLRKSDEQVFLELEERKNQVKEAFENILDDEIPNFGE